MDNEERLRTALQRESERIEVSSDLRRRLNARIGRGSGLRSRALALSVAVVLAAVGIAVWLVAGRGPVKESLIAPPGEDAYFAGYWPVATRAEAEAMQRRVDGGEEAWRRDPERVAQEYANTLGWNVPDGISMDTETSGLRAEGRSATTTIAPGLPDGRPGPTHTVHLVGVPGTDDPAWFVSGIDSPNIGVDDPKPNVEAHSPLRVSGTGHTYEGSILVTVVDDGGHKLGQSAVTAGGSERAPFEGSIDLTQHSAAAGVVQFEGGNGVGGPSTDVTIVRVRFSAAVEGSPQATPQAIVDDYAADDAFRCFIGARHYRNLELAKPCMTERYADSVTDPVEFIGPSSPSVERATIVSSSRSGNRVVYDALVYWGSSTGLQFVSEDTVTVILDGDEALVDSWAQGTQEPIGETTTVRLSFLALGDTPNCVGDEPSADSFETIDRVVPTEVVVDDLALSVAREMVTGQWAHEPDGAGVFPNGTRVERVTVADGVATVQLNRVPEPLESCDYALTALRLTLTRLDGITDVVLEQAPPQASIEPDV